MQLTQKEKQFNVYVSEDPLKKMISMLHCLYYNWDS
jgi:hypothetical protein